MNRTTWDKRDLYLSGTFLLLALLLRLWGIQYGLPASYNSTEYFIAKDALSLGARKTLEPLQFIYPSLYTYLIAALYALCYLVGWIAGIFRGAADFGFQFLENPTCFYLLGRLFNALSFALAAALFYRTVRFLLPRRKAALVSSLFVFCGIFHYYTFWMVPDGLLLPGTVASLYFLIRYMRFDQSKRDLIAGAILTGLTISVKYNAGFLALGWLGAVWLWESSSFKSRGKVSTVFGGFLLLGFILGSPYWVIDFSRYLEGLSTVWSQSRYLYEPGSREMFLWEFRAMVQHDGLLGVIFIFLLFQMLFRINRFRTPLVLIALPTFVLVASRPKKGLDYMLVVFPILLLLAAEWLSSRDETRLRRWFQYALLLALLINIPWRLYDDFRRTQPDTRELTREWIIHHYPPGTPLCYDHYHIDLGLLDAERFRSYGQGSRILPAEIKRRLSKLEKSPLNYRFISPLKTLPYPQVPDSLRHLVEHDPFLNEVFTHPHKSFKEIREEGARLIILNGETFRRYFTGVPPPRENPFRIEWMRRREFYQAVMDSLPEVHRFLPDWRHPGPEIRIYSLASPSAGDAASPSPNNQPSHRE